MSKVAEFVPAVGASELAEGVMIAVDVNSNHIILARVGSEVEALSGVCTHEDADLGLCFRIEDGVVGPLHLSQFNLKTGEVLNPPAVTPLRKYKTKTDGGTILVEV